MGEIEGDTVQFQQLLDRAAGGSQDAYGELINRASERLLRLTRKMLRSYPHLRRWEQTDDVFQTAARRLHRSLSEVKPESVRHFFALAATQIRRTLIDLARHHFGPEGQAAKHQSHAGEGVSHGHDLRNKPDTGDPPETLESWAQFQKKGRIQKRVAYTVRGGGQDDVEATGSELEEGGKEPLLAGTSEVGRQASPWSARRAPLSTSTIRRGTTCHPVWIARYDCCPDRPSRRRRGPPPWRRGASAGLTWR